MSIGNSTFHIRSNGALVSVSMCVFCCLQLHEWIRGGFFFSILSRELDHQLGHVGFYGGNAVSVFTPAPLKQLMD